MTNVGLTKFLENVAAISNTLNTLMQHVIQQEQRISTLERAYQDLKVANPVPARCTKTEPPLTSPVPHVHVEWWSGRQHLINAKDIIIEHLRKSRQ